MLFQVQFQGPETDAFFADMSQFTGSTPLRLPVFWELRLVLVVALIWTQKKLAFLRKNGTLHNIF